MRLRRLTALGTAAACAVALMAGTATPATAAVTFLYTIPAFTTATGNVITEGSSYSAHAYCRIYGLTSPGGMSATNAISWNVAAFTGNGPPSPVSNYQRGSSSYGGPACQVDGTSQAAAGAMLNAGYATGTSSSSLMGFQLIHAFNPTASSPSAWANGPFRLQVNWDLAYQSLAGSIQYSQICASFLDKSSGLTLRWCPKAYDSRGLQPEYLLADPSGVDSQGRPIAYIVGTNFRTSQNYSTLVCTSQDDSRDRYPSGGSLSDWYAAYFSFQNLTAAANALNSRFGLSGTHSFSTNAANYALSEVLAGTEMTRGAGTGSMGARVANFQVMDDSTPCT